MGAFAGMWSRLVALAVDSLVVRNPPAQAFDSGDGMVETLGSVLKTVPCSLQLHQRSRRDRGSFTEAGVREDLNAARIYCAFDPDFLVAGLEFFISGQRWYLLEPVIDLGGQKQIMRFNVSSERPVLP